MFFDDPDAAFANLARSLGRGGRTVFTCWQSALANEWLMVPAGAALAHVPLPELGEAGQPGPFSLAEPDRIRSILEGAGFADVNVEDLRCPMRTGSTVEAVRKALGPYSGPNGVVLQGAAWLVTATTQVQRGSRPV
jgi:hypothetical protein